MTVLDALLDARTPETPALAEAFEEGLHPRDFRGKFAKKLAGLKLGQTAHAPGGVSVKREEEGFAIKGGGAMGHFLHKPSGEMRTGRPAADEKLSSPNSAASLATVRSLRSRDPKSLGGDRHYHGIEDYESDHGKPPSGSSATPATVDDDIQAIRRRKIGDGPPGADLAALQRNAEAKRKAATPEKMSNQQARFVASIRRAGQRVVSTKLLSSGDLNVQWIGRNGKKMAQNIPRGGGSVREAEVGKPGTNWKQVTPEHRKKIGAIVRHYMKMAHPFAACVRDNRKRFGARTEQVCAVVKDMGERTTKWRKGRKGKVAETAVTQGWTRMVAEAMERLGVIEGELGPGSSIRLAEQTDSADERVRPLAEQVFNDRALLCIVGVMSDEEFMEDAMWDASKHPRGGKGSPTGGKFVAKGSSGDETRGVQEKVGAKVDGKFGAKTEAAVRAYQKKHGLQVDGKVGRQTAAAIRGKKNAAKIKTGALSVADRHALAKGKGKAPKLGRTSTPVSEVAESPIPFSAAGSRA